MVTCDLEVKRNGLDPLKDALNEFTSLLAVSVVGQLDPHEKLGRGHGADGDIRVVRKHVLLVALRTLERDQRARVEDQSRHGSSVGALPTKSRMCSTSASH